MKEIPSKELNAYISEFIIMVRKKNNNIFMCFQYEATLHSHQFFFGLLLSGPTLMDGNTREKHKSNTDSPLGLLIAQKYLFVYNPGERKGLSLLRID